MTDPSESTNGTDVAGGSARREYERRKAKDEAATRDRWGRFGNLAVALTDERQSTRAWSTGAVGEEVVGARLDSIASDRIRVMHDRKIPGSRSNIDHLVVTPGGIWVVDAKRLSGRPELHVEGGLFRPRVEHLRVRGRDKTSLVEGVLRQVEHVRRQIPGVPVRSALCFVDADWPLIGGSFQVRGVDALWSRRLAKLIVESASGDIDVSVVGSAINARFRRAV